VARQGETLATTALRRSRPFRFALVHGARAASQVERDAGHTEAVFGKLGPGQTSPLLAGGHGNGLRRLHAGFLLRRCGSWVSLVPDALSFQLTFVPMTKPRRPLKVRMVGNGLLLQLDQA
jgi:hypothetical protein